MRISQTLLGRGILMKHCQLSRRQLLRCAGAVGLAALGLADRPASAQSPKYRQKILAKRPVAYWRLGERRGLAAFDATEQRYNGTYYGTPTYRVGGAITCDPNTAIRLDGHQ